MGASFTRRDRSGEQRWWLEVMGKGDKIRIVPATGELMEELSRYRRELGLTLYPIQGAPTPLLLPIGGKMRSLSRGGIHEIVKHLFAATGHRLWLRGVDYANDVLRVERASAHWQKARRDARRAEES